MPSTDWIVVDKSAGMSQNETAGSVEALQARVDGLYHLRAHFFDTYDIKVAGDKNEILREKTKSIISQADEFLRKLEKENGKGSSDDNLKRALLLFLKGKTLNVVQDFDADSEEALSKSIKLDPGRPEAWNALGECLWKKKDVEGAKDCFQCALNHHVNKEALRNLSIIHRQLNGSPAQRLENVKESIVKGKEAVTLDVKDGVSWMVLGNAYLTLFFMGDQEPKLLSQALAAYKNAERDPGAEQDSHFHYNRAVIFNYKGMYKDALTAHRRAASLEPGWSEPVKAADAISHHLDYISTKLLSARADLQNVDLSRLKVPHTKLNGKKILTVSALNSTPQERELGCVLLTVVSDPNPEEGVSRSVVVADRDANIFLLSMYNFPADVATKTGMKITVLCPAVVSVVLSLSNFAKDELKMMTIRVDNPSFIWVDDQHVDQLAKIELKITAQSE